jgi:SnoaL-like domain
MAGEHVRAIDDLQELEELRQLKARYCRFLDTKDVESWRAVFTTDLVFTLDTAVSVGGADPMTTPPVEGLDNFVPMVMGGLENVATKHLEIQRSHTPELTLASATTATGIWAMEDLLVFGDGRELYGAGHHHETYEKPHGSWQIKSLHLTRTMMKLSGSDDK